MGAQDDLCASVSPTVNGSSNSSYSYIEQLCFLSITCGLCLAGVPCPVSHGVSDMDVATSVSCLKSMICWFASSFENRSCLERGAFKTIREQSACSRPTAMAGAECGHMGRMAVVALWPGLLAFTLTGRPLRHELAAADKVEEQGSRPQHVQKDQGGPQGDCSHSCGLLSSSQELSGARKEPLLCRTLLYLPCLGI